MRAGREVNVEHADQSALHVRAFDIDNPGRLTSVVLVRSHAQGMLRLESLAALRCSFDDGDGNGGDN